MKLNKIIRIADRRYPDGMIRRHWDTRPGRPAPDTRGDTLALFVVRELDATYDPKKSDEEQLNKAAHAVDRAIHDLLAVRLSLETAAARTTGRSLVETWR